MTTIINGSSPSITFSDGSAQTSATRPFLNRLINGGMTIDQRNAGASVTQTTSTIYTLDRWNCYGAVASKFTVQQSSTAPVGFVNSALITSSSAYSVGSGEIFQFVQPIEGYNVADLNWGSANAKTVTLSFWVRSSLTGTFGGAVQNSASNRSYPFTYTILSANTYEQKSVTITGDTTGTWLTTNGVGMYLYFGLGVGSTYSGTAGAWAASDFHSATGATSVVGTNGATFYITGVQLEVGSTATSFDYRPYGTELALCQRYYQTSAINVPDTNCGFFGVVYGGGSTQAYGNASFKTLMRATPTVTLYDGGTAGNVAQAGIGGSAATAGNINAYGFSIVNKTSGNFTTTAGYSIVAGFTASSEL